MFATLSTVQNTRPTSRSQMNTVWTLCYCHWINSSTLSHLALLTPGPHFQIIYPCSPWLPANAAISDFCHRKPSKSISKLYGSLFLVAGSHIIVWDQQYGSWLRGVQSYVQHNLMQCQWHEPSRVASHPSDRTGTETRGVNPLFLSY